jgi:hypothetical protein
MRTQTSIVLFAAFLLAAACGGDSDTTTGGDPQAPEVDGGDDTATPDAMVAEAGQVGASCDSTAGVMCPVDVPACVSLDMDGADQFCTKPCGTSADAMTPPAEGDAACAEGYVGAATPACVLGQEAGPGMVNWYCGLGCGTAGGMSFGDCPANLVCEGASDTTIGICK